MTTRLKNKLATAKDQVREAYLNGATLREIGDVHGVSAGTVRNTLRELGVEMRPRGRRKKDDGDNSRVLAVDALSPDVQDVVENPSRQVVSLDPTPPIEFGL